MICGEAGAGDGLAAGAGVAAAAGAIAGLASAGAAFAYALALSLGDLGVVALFGSEALVTLPALLYERLGAYRMGEAEGVAALLSALVLVFFLTADRIGSAHAVRL